MEHRNEHPRDRIYRAYWQDGSLDLFAGLGVTGIAVAWFVDHVELSALAPIAAVGLWTVFRRRVVAPRFGDPTFDPRRRSQMWLRAWQVVILGLVACLAVGTGAALRVQGQGSVWASALAPAIPAVLIAFASTLAAVMFHLPRLFGYGAVAAVSGGVVAALDGNPAWGILCTGLIAVIAGCALLIRFLHEFKPLPAEMD